MAVAGRNLGRRSPVGLGPRKPFTAVTWAEWAGPLANRPAQSKRPLSGEHPCHHSKCSLSWSWTPGNSLSSWTPPPSGAFDWGGAPARRGTS